MGHMLSQGHTGRHGVLNECLKIWKKAKCLLQMTRQLLGIICKQQDMTKMYLSFLRCTKQFSKLSKAQQMPSAEDLQPQTLN